MPVISATAAVSVSAGRIGGGALSATLAEVREMTAAMLDAEKEWLPQFQGNSLRPAPVVSIPEDVKPVEVPLDPALAIANRFGDLAERATE